MGAAGRYGWWVEVGGLFRLNNKENDNELLGEGHLQVER
jgi:hypothetical protein